MTNLGNLWQKQALSALCLLLLIWPGLAGCACPSSSTKGKSPLKSEEKLHNRGALRKTNQQ